MAMHALPPKSARELAHIVGRLDSRILDHPALRHTVSPRGPWWRFSLWPWEDSCGSPEARLWPLPSLTEGQEAQRDGRSAEYEGVYGLTAEPPISEWEGHDPQPLSVDEFEVVWSTPAVILRIVSGAPLPEHGHQCGFRPANCHLQM
ncbi:hypothetical protein ACFT0G_28355 [Streptomyces sp. NPDC057020]|uniref:hypothetical protein n=1 Tax=unclassified Streptomyces TaxID=2593676 RepID=UPI00362CB3BC